MNVLEEAEKFNPVKKVSSHKGGEYHGACPGCGGDDRFHVWPEQNGGQGSYWCRGCGKGGDLIQFLMDFCGKNFPEAARLSGKELAKEEMYRAPRPPKSDSAAGPGWVPVSPSDIDKRTSLWKEHASRLVGWAHNQLMKNSEMMAWLISRGIGKDAMVEFKLGLNTGKNGKDLWRPRESWGLHTVIKDNGQKKRLWIPRGLVIPYIIDNEIVRVRIRRFGDVEPRYYILPGGSSQAMVLGRGKKAHAVIESELDAIMVFEKVRDLGVGTIGLGSSSAKPDSDADEDLSQSLCILNALDYDRAGKSAYEWWKKQYARCVRWPVPEGKDPGEAFAAGVDIREWIRAGLPPAMTIAPSRLFSARNREDAEQKQQTEPEQKNSALPEKKTDDTKPDGPVLPEAPESVIRLYTLLKNNPVKIRHSNRQTTIFQNPMWEKKNWGLSKEISALVYFDKDCWSHINTHTAGVITWNNFFKKEADARY